MVMVKVMGKPGLSLRCAKPCRRDLPGDLSVDWEGMGVLWFGTNVFISYRTLEKQVMAEMVRAQT